MKTIEERAKDYAPDAFDADLILPAKEGYIVKVQRDAYIQGATEQKSIDIEKACEYLRNIKSWDYYDDEECDLMTEDDINDFRKAMEK